MPQIIEGIKCSEYPVNMTHIKCGDLYMAKRNTGWHLLTCKEYKIKENFVIPAENAYCYNANECFKVLEK